MPDEANSHWYSVLQSLTEGQTWLKKTFNITPGIYLKSLHSSQLPLTIPII